MTYDDLLAQCKRAVSAGPEAGAENLLDVIQVLNHHSPFNRQMACEKIAFLMAEFIEAPTQQAARSTKH